MNFTHSAQNPGSISCKMSPSDVKLKDAKQALAEDQFDDCMSCRVMGMFTLYSTTFAVFTFLLMHLRRIRCVRWPRRLQLLHWNGQPAQTRESDYARCYEIQDGFTPTRNRLDISNSGRNGTVASIQLNVVLQTTLEHATRYRLRACADQVVDIAGRNGNFVRY